MVGLVSGLINSICRLSPPVLSSLAIAYVEQPVKDLRVAVGILLAILFVKLIGNIAESHLFFNMDTVSLRATNCISLAIFDKASRCPTMCSKKHSTAQLINYSQVDAANLETLGEYTHAVIMFPFELIIGVCLMYYQMGVSFTAGVAVLVLLTILIHINYKFTLKANE